MKRSVDHRGNEGDAQVKRAFKLGAEQVFKVDCCHGVMNSTALPRKALWLLDYLLHRQ